MLNKKILMSAGVIVFVGALIAGATGAFFSDTETSTGNTFTAGAIDLKIDSECSYNNGNPGTCGEWQLKDLDPTADKFFNFSDVKPGDSGITKVSLHVFNNDAWGCMNIGNLLTSDVVCTEPEEDEEGATCSPLGDLQDELMVFIWTQTDNDNAYNPGDSNEEALTPTPVLASTALNSVYAVADSSNGFTLAGSSNPDVTRYVNIAWCAGTLTLDGSGVPLCDGDSMTNASQADSMTADVSFTVVQKRNNENYTCVAPQGPEVSESDGWSSVDSQGKDWFAKAKVQEAPNPASDFEVQVGVGDSDPSQFDQGDTVYSDNVATSFTLVYNGSGTATFTANGVETSYSVGTSDISNIGITIKAPSDGTTSVTGLSLSTDSLSDTEVSVSNGTKNLTITGANLNSGFTLSGYVTFDWGTLTSNGENQKMQISVN